MKCPVCKKGRMVEKTVSEMIEIDGAPSFKVEDIHVLECGKCRELLVDSISAKEKTRLTVQKLIQYYAPRMRELPGKVAYWMRHALGLSQSELAEQVGGIDPSTFAHAAARNTFLDQYSAFVLLSLSADFVTGGSDGRKLIERTKKVNQIVEKRAAS
jgi:YgiT-type zinc finger domain-containing protein